MGPKKRNRASHSKQSKVTSSDHSKGDTEEPKQKDKSAERSAMQYLLRGIPKSSHKRIHRYWASLSIDLKKEFLKIKVDDLKNHFNTPRYKMDNYINKVVEGVKSGKSWTAWVCFDCDVWYKDPESYLHHIGKKHFMTLPSDMDTLYPPTINKDWFEGFNERCWEPLDASAAIQMLENRRKSEEESSPKEYDWPQLNDYERAKFLKNIQRELNLLVRHKCLSGNFLVHVIKLAKNEISGLYEGSQILNDALDQSPHCICFLGTPNLKMISGFLVKLVDACDLVIGVDKSTNPPDDLQNSNQLPEIEENIHLIEDASCLFLDESLLLAPDTTESAAEDDVIYTDPFLSWIFSGSCFEQWDFWDGIKVDRIHQQKKLVKAFQKEFEELKGHCMYKCVVMEYNTALKEVDDLCLEEDKNREILPEYVQRSYVSALRKRKEELSMNEEHVCNTYVLDVITNLLEEAQSIKTSLSGSEENPIGAYDLESEMDTFIRTAIEKLKGTYFEELSIIDGKILRSITKIEPFEATVRPDTDYDFRGQFLPLLKTYLQTRLDDLAAKYASDSLLAELDTESEKRVKGGRDSAKHKEKTKTKKITKENRKTNTSDLKATHGDEKQVLDTNIADNSSVASAKKKRLEERLTEIQGKKKSFAEQKKELEKERVQFNIEIGEKIEKIEKKKHCLAHKRKQLEDEEETIRIELQKLIEEAQDASE